MKFLYAFAVLVAISAASAAILDFHPLSDENIALINQKAKTWKAGKNFEVHEWKRVKKLMSGVLPGFFSRSKESYKSNPHNEDENVPEYFDAREAWPNCDAIKQIRDQSSCGCCWAMSATEAMSDRICIHSNQTKQVYVSTENLIACCLDTCGLGCDGGMIDAPWEYWKETGIVTGGAYNSSQGCQDYSMEPCEHASDTASETRPACSSMLFDTPKCSKTCYNTSLNYDDSITYGQDVVTFTNAKQMQVEIYKNGPIEAGFYMYSDFVNYKSGVYQKTTDFLSGGHAIKILGWGVENDTPYWLCANSFNEDWGDHGFFKILRGEDHCSIESHVAASLPRL